MRASFALIPLVLFAACAAPGDVDLDGAEDLGSIGTKDDSVTHREVAIDLAPGATKRFRVTAHRFHAAFGQDDAGDGLEAAMLSAKHYDIEIEGPSAHDPQLEAAAPTGQDEILRNWTLRVHNLGTGQLTGTLAIESIVELPADGDALLREVSVEIPAGGVKRFRIAGPSIVASLTTSPGALSQLSAKHYDIEAVGDPGTAPTLEVLSPGDEIRNWTVRVHNLSADTLTGELRVEIRRDLPPPPATTGRPTATSPVQASNEFATYAEALPYVSAVKWAHPLIQRAMAAMGPGYRSIFTYREWRVAYGLENERTGTDEEKRNKKVRNFIRVLVGELRDYPDLLRQRLTVIADHQSYASADEVPSFDTTENLFDQLSYPAYQKMVQVMRMVHTHRAAQLASSDDGYHHGFGAHGYGSRRVNKAVPPFDHCDMKFMFNNYMTENAPAWPDAAQYEAEYAVYRANVCTADDFEWMYNFRGHVNFQPLWLESNAFNMNSLRARGAAISRGDESYYQRPFATRHAAARSAWGSYLFYRDADHRALISASERDGGPILYITDQDLDEDGLADYRLFDTDGCGDQGIGRPIPADNCNMVSWDEAWSTPNTTGHASTWNASDFGQPDMGFLSAFATFGERMARFNQALDRHTNWGPTSYYMLDASNVGDISPRVYGAYSPIVAASYDVSASAFFITRNYSTTSDFERGRAKWLFVMKFPASRYYDSGDLEAGRPIDFDENYFSEPSLSNDFYDERALDHWGYIPGEEHHAQIYLTYGDRGDSVPDRVAIPAP
ncbi:MAG: hypothetical protein JRH11_11565 [Deltaproteobacteria bacterium]|nr:hypothetical protein [Deltaproteobacteria bacterium]